MDSLPPIPTPPRLILRELRIRLVPVVFFLCVVAAVFYLWRTHVHPITVVGQVETNTAQVISVQDGTLTELTVDLLDRVCKGQVIGRVAVTDPELAQAALEAIAWDLRVTKARMDLDKVRNLDSYSRLRLDLLTEQTALALAQIRVRQAEAEYQRAQELYKQGLIPAGVGAAPGAALGVEVAERDRNMLREEIAHRTKTIAQLEAELQLLELVGATNVSTRDPVIEEAIRAHQEQLTLQTSPQKLKAPIDGVVSAVLKRPGEKVIRGMPVVTITPLTSERIVAHIRQPLGRLPTTNDLVRIRTRGSPRQTATAPILKVGTQLEPIDPYLLSPDGTRHELGLPLLVSIPPGLKLRPGEYVDLFIEFSNK
jgi:multidrug resistance efflux pump